MSSASILRGLTLGLIGLGLAACGNAPGREVTAVSIAKGLFTGGIFSGGDTDTTPDRAEVARLAANVLANTTGQAVIIWLPDRDALTVMQQIERNGDYVTFGTSDRRSITLKQGVLTATRGLGDDLMSANVAAVSPLIHKRREGAARRINRYLDGENLTTELSPWCQTKLAGGGQVAIGEINSPATLVLESCTAKGAAFQNSYMVSPSGRILQSRQWVSGLNGYLNIQSLR